MDSGGVIASFSREMARQGWQVSSQDGDQALSRDGLMVRVGANRHWLRLALPGASPGRDDSHRLARLLSVSERCFMAKWSLDEGGALLPEVELPLMRLERRDCEKALEALLLAAKWVDGRPLLAAAEADAARAPKRSAVEGQAPEFFPLEELRTYFATVKHLDWAIRDRIDENHWKALYEGAERAFEVYLSFDRAWVYLQAPLLGRACAPSSQSPTCRKVFYPYLLRLNAEMYWAKVGLDEDGQVVLGLDIPLEMFDIQRFRWAARTLGTYADQYAYDVQVLADLDRDARLAALLDSD